jgi:hypothetical protein
MAREPNCRRDALQRVPKLFMAFIARPSILRVAVASCRATGRAPVIQTPTVSTQGVAAHLRRISSSRPVRSSDKPGLLARYSEVMQKYPLISNIVSAGVIGASGASRRCSNCLNAIGRWCRGRPLPVCD